MKNIALYFYLGFFALTGVWLFFCLPLALIRNGGLSAARRQHKQDQDELFENYGVSPVPLWANAAAVITHWWGMNGKMLKDTAVSAAPKGLVIADENSNHRAIIIPWSALKHCRDAPHIIHQRVRPDRSDGTYSYQRVMKGRIVELQLNLGRKDVSIHLWCQQAEKAIYLRSYFPDLGVIVPDFVPPNFSSDLIT